MVFYCGSCRVFVSRKACEGGKAIVMKNCSLKFCGAIGELGRAKKMRPDIPAGIGPHG